MSMNLNAFFTQKKAKAPKADADSEMARSVTKCLGRAWDNESYADFTVRVGRQSFKCHKFILSACSEFFAALLRSDMQEKATGTATVEGMTAETFKLILDAIYKGQSILDVNNMLDVWQGAHQLQIDFLIRASENFIVEHISIKNYLDVYQVANLLESDKVNDAVHTLMIEQFSNVMSSKPFPDLPPDCLLALVSSEALKVSKDVAVKAILAWTRGQPFGQRDEAHGESVGQCQGELEQLFRRAIEQQNSRCETERENHPILGHYAGQLVGGRQDSAYLRFAIERQKHPALRVSPEQLVRDSQEFVAQPHATFAQPDGFDNSKEIPPEHKWRQDHLVRLLEAVNLDKISNDCVSVLMNDQTIQACVEALHMVSRIAAKRLSGQAQGYHFVN